MVMVLVVVNKLLLVIGTVGGVVGETGGEDHGEEDGGVQDGGEEEVADGEEEVVLYQSVDGEVAEE